MNYQIEPVYSRNVTRAMQGRCSYHLVIVSPCGTHRATYYVDTYLGALKLVQLIGLHLSPSDRDLASGVDVDWESVRVA